MTPLDHYLVNKGSFLASAFNAIQDGFIVLDRDLTIVLANRWMEKKYASQMPLTGKKCDTVLRNVETSCLAGPHLASLAAGTPHIEVLPYPSAKTPIEWLEIALFRFEDDDGKLIGSIGHIKDITERKRSEELLKDEATRWRLLVEQSRDGIVVLEQDGKVYEANQQYAHMLGYTMEEVHQLHVWDWDTQWSKTELLGMIQSVDSTGDHFETRHRRKDGTLCDVEISTNGAVYRGQKLIFCVCRDITGRKKAEKERETLITELRQALKEINTLRSILPLCSFCKKIRDDQGYWEQVDVYLYKHSLADISHSICPDCLKEHYPEMEDS